MYERMHEEWLKGRYILKSTWKYGNNWWAKTCYCQFLVYAFIFLGTKICVQYTKRQISLLRSEFCRSPCVSKKTVERLSKELGIGTSDIYQWFDNQRAYINKLEVKTNWQGNHCT